VRATLAPLTNLPLTSALIPNKDRENAFQHPCATQKSTTVRAYLTALSPIFTSGVHIF
jgi:hypothetical protein